MLLKITSTLNQFDFIILDTNDKTKWNTKIDISTHTPKISVEVNKMGDVLGNPKVKIELITKLSVFMVDDSSVDPKFNFIDFYSVNENDKLKLISKSSPERIQNFSNSTIKTLEKELPYTADYNLLTEKEYSELIKV